jgi:predicted Fe-Mo cluster-binding NifX family protein
MKIAIPMANGRLSPHFGHCETFAFIEVDRSEKKILKREDVGAPPHQPGFLPEWIASHGAQMILAGGMGVRALELFEQKGIQVLVGVPSEDPETLVKSWLDDELALGDNVCDH